MISKIKKQQGFTLIELVVVIIILGILAVTVAPKFINLESDARTATVMALAGAINSANNLVYSKSAIAGNETQEYDNIDSDNTPYILNSAGERVELHYGYIAGQWEDGFGNILDIDAAAYDNNYPDGSDGTSIWVYKEPVNWGVSYFTIFLRGETMPTGALEQDTCGITYSIGSTAFYNEVSVSAITNGC